MKDLMRRAVIQAIVVTAFWAVFLLGLLKSLDVGFAWWKGDLPMPGFGDLVWMALLPVWLFVYFRFLSVFRPGCTACAVDEKRREPMGPKGA